MNIYDFILHKRRGGEHTEGELRELIRGFTDGSIPDYQMSAWTMAVCFSGMTETEAAALTLAMAESGDCVDLSRLGDVTVDKHSTGGVGDKTTVVVAPIVAAAGAVIAKMSGRGLGHTGGTVDKLESFPGFRTELGGREFFEQARRIGIVVTGQSGNMVPADKKLYALRDVTATVDSIPLIASSIMSKKLAAGAKSIVLDVKFGSGAFFSSEASARDAALLMVRIGQASGRRVSAVLSDMDAPLGYAIGNALEIKEALRLLRGEQDVADLREVSLTLAAEMLSLGLGVSADEGRERAERALTCGAAYDKLREWIAVQGGDLAYVECPELLKSAPLCREIAAAEDGYIASMNASEIGMSALLLGAGRRTKADRIDHGAGIVLCRKPGDRVSRGERIATLYADSEARLSDAAARFERAVTYGAQPRPGRRLIAGIIR